MFLDLKMADIPTTVNRAARVLGALGVSYLTLHAFAGPAVLRAGVEGLTEGAGQAGLPQPAALAVTILTSDADAPPHILGKRVAAAVEARCAGVVCAASDVREAKQLAPRMLAVVPGLRPDRLPGPRSGALGHPGRGPGRRRRLAGHRPGGDRRGRPAGRGSRRWSRQSRKGRRRRAMVRGMPLPPALSAEQRQAALEKAAVARRMRAELKEKLKMGSVTLSELLRKPTTTRWSAR